MKEADTRELDLLIAEGEEAVLSVRDSAAGGSKTSMRFSNPSTPPRNPVTASGWAWRFPRAS
jgi:hypothetical protein